LIEVASYPTNLATFKPSVAHPYYFEVFGETTPLLDTTYAELQPSGALDAAGKRPSSAPVYEYWWTIGHGGRHTRHHWFGDAEDEDPDAVWDNLEDVAAYVYLYFPVSRGWRIKELAATTKYLSPVRDSTTLLTALAEDWQHVSPALGEATQMAALVPPVAPIAGAAVGASTVLDTLAKLKINSIPPTGEFRWSVAKVTFANADGAMQGVMWELPKRMFTDIGGRLTGSLALSFIPASVQKPGEVCYALPDPQPGAICAHAVVRAKDGDRWAPAKNEFVELTLGPRVPQAKATETGITRDA
jgi:hypothetical protein